jgi:transcriptional regulator with XRE-family HTH domain
MEQRINRIKVVLAEKQRTNKWLAENLGREYSTISKWCTNTNQPDLITLTKIAHLLEVDIRELLVSGSPTLKDSDFTSGSK